MFERLKFKRKTEAPAPTPPSPAPAPAQPNPATANITLATSTRHSPRHEHDYKVLVEDPPSSQTFALDSPFSDNNRRVSMIHSTHSAPASAPASAPSSATPSRSSSTSHRGPGMAILSSQGSFTPLSATPPLTPRLAHDPLDSHLATACDQAQAQAHPHPHPPHYRDNRDSRDSRDLDAFVASPTSFQPPVNPLSSHLSHLQLQPAPLDPFQLQYAPVPDPQQQPLSAGQEHLSRIKSMAMSHGHPPPGRDSLLHQQQFYQQQQRQQMDDDMIQRNGSTATHTPAQPVVRDPSIASAVAAALAQATAPPGAIISIGADQPHAHPSRAGPVLDRAPCQQDPPHPTTPTAPMMASPISRASTSLLASHLITHDLRHTAEHAHIEEGSGPVVLMAIGKTGQGKSSLLNRIMGTTELKASASVRAVTKGIAERTGWGRFEDSRRVLVTLADTPGLADTEGDDEKNIPILKEYIQSVGTRIGVTAFLLVFKIDSGVDMIITILQTFDEIMQDFPDFWDNVVLVFTGCDYRRNVMNTKQLYHEAIQAQLQEHFFKARYGPSASPPSETAAPVVPMVFLTTAEAPCGFALGEKCDCKARTTFLNAGIKRLWYAIRNKKRWVVHHPDDDGEEDMMGHA